MLVCSGVGGYDGVHSVGSEERARSMLEDLDLSGIPDERARECIVRLLNLLEDVTAELRLDASWSSGP
ncbi:MAG: hypothetical protein HY690_09930 [Chloroflexi bacterium]|nr:hypothetical protein [Chloroflexota bacterium]